MNTYLTQFNLTAREEDKLEGNTGVDLKTPLKAKIESLGGKVIGLWFKSGDPKDECLFIYELDSPSAPSQELNEVISASLGEKVEASSSHVFNTYDELMFQDIAVGLRNKYFGPEDDS